jgi:hypothetical protein
MTKDEALRLAWDALENSVDLVRENAYSAEQLYGNYPARQGKVRGLKVLADDHEKAITAIKEALAQPEPNYKKALEVWLDKTEWVQETVKPHELGMHRADVLKQRIEATLAQLEQDLVEWGVDWGPDGNSVSIIKRLADGGIEVVGWEYAPHPPQRTWVALTDEEISDCMEMSIQKTCRAIEAKLKEKNT